MDDGRPLTAYQHQYTSCRKGRGAGSGFQTRTSSEDLTFEDRTEVERRGVYTPPRGVSAEPTDDEIDQEFPRAFRYWTLGSNYWALAYSCYSGRDYSRRWGNYFVHTLVGIPGEQLNIWPIDLYEWSGWKRRLEPGEDTEDVPASLPSVNVNAIAPAASFTYEELSEFLKENSDRTNRLRLMIMAMCQFRQTSRALVIRDTFLNGLFWVACLQKALPLEYARGISFSTYQYDDRQCAAINITTEGTDFTFDEIQREYQFFMFDYLHGQNSQIAKDSIDYAETVSSWMTTDPKTLAEFHEFAAHFRGGEVGPELDALVHAFQLSRGVKITLGSGQRSELLMFIDQRSTVAGRNEVLPAVASLAASLPSGATAEEYSALIRVLSRSAALNNSTEYRQLAFGVWCDFYDEIGFYIGSEPASARASYREMMQHLQAFEKDAAEAFVSTEHLHKLLQRLEKQPAQTIEAVLRDFCGFLKRLGRLPLLEQLEVRSIVNLIVDSRDNRCASIAKVLGVLSDSPNEIVEACQYLAKGIAQKREHESKSHVVGRALHRVLSDKPEQYCRMVRNQLDELRAFEILHGEWLEVSNHKSDKLDTYYDYFNSIMIPLPNYKKKYGSVIAEEAVRSTTAKRRLDQSVRWLQQPGLDWSTDGFLKQCVKWVSEGILLDRELSAPVPFAQLSMWADKLGVQLAPNTPALAEAVKISRSVNWTTEFDKVLKRMPGDLQHITDSNYNRFLSLFLPEALLLADNSSDRHRAVISSAYLDNFDNTFGSLYLSFLDQVTRGFFSKVHEAALIVWLSRDGQRVAPLGMAVERRESPHITAKNKVIESIGS